MDNLAFHSAKALLMSAGGGLVVRKSLEAVGLRQPENPDIGLLPSLTPEELSEYLLDAGYDEPPHAPLIAGALPAPKPAAPASLLSIAVRKTLAEPLVLSSDRLTPSALAAWACGAAAALLLIKLMQLSCAERGAQYTVHFSEPSHEGPALLDVRRDEDGTAADEHSGWRRGNLVHLGSFRRRRIALQKATWQLGQTMKRQNVTSALLVCNPR